MQYSIRCENKIEISTAADGNYKLRNNRNENHNFIEIKKASAIIKISLFIPATTMEVCVCVR
jgi:hypothetical protein